MASDDPRVDISPEAVGRTANELYADPGCKCSICTATKQLRALRAALTAAEQLNRGLLDVAQGKFRSLVEMRAEQQACETCRHKGRPADRKRPSLFWCDHHGERFNDPMPDGQPFGCRGWSPRETPEEPHPSPDEYGRGIRESLRSLTRGNRLRAEGDT